MRLIDADELMTEVCNKVASHGDKRSYRQIVEEMPTVEAIPVEWLLNNIPKDSVMWEYNRKLIEYLVIGWREENESNISD